MPDDGLPGWMLARNAACHPESLFLVVAILNTEPFHNPQASVRLGTPSAWLGSIDIFTLLLVLVPWQFSPLLGLSGLAYSFSRLRASANGRTAPVWSALIFLVLFAVWLVLSGWAVPLLLVTAAGGFVLLIRKFIQDNSQTWKTSDRTILAKAVLRTLKFTGIIGVLLSPGIVAGIVTHRLAAVCVAELEKVPTRNLTNYIPETVAPPWYHFGDYLAYECDPRRLLMGEIRDELTTRRQINEAPRHLSQLTWMMYRCLDLTWWVFVVYTFYVAFRLYLYIFARTFVASGGRAVVQLE